MGAAPENDVDEHTAPLRQRQWWNLSPLRISLGLGLLSLVMSLWQLSVPGLVSNYDSGVYFGAALHLVYGALPYRDFTFVQPPGIVVLFSPLAALGRIFSSHLGFQLTRVFSAFVTASNVGLLAWLVRHRGRFAQVIAGGGLAVLPVAFLISSSAKLEPYCLVLVLLAAVVLFPSEADGVELSTRRLVIGGLIFGFAVLVKLWAVFPLIAALICLIPRYRQRVLFLAGSTLASFAIIALPFFVAAPTNFISQVIVEQLVRRSPAAQDLGVGSRLVDMTGFLSTSLRPSITLASAAFVGLAVVAYVGYRQSAHLNIADSFFLLAAIITFVGLLAPHAYFIWYGYFIDPFLLAVLAIALARCGPGLRALANKIGVAQPIQRLTKVFVSALVLCLIAGLAIWTSRTYEISADRTGLRYASTAVITRLVPPGACVVFNEVSLGIYSNRMISSSPSCPDVVDPYGMYMAWGYGVTRPPEAFSLEWKRYFEQAQYVVFSHANGPYIPWGTSLLPWFHRNFHLIYAGKFVYVYVR